MKLLLNKKSTKFILFAVSLFFLISGGMFVQYKYSVISRAKHFVKATIRSLGAVTNPASKFTYSNKLILVNEPLTIFRQDSEFIAPLESRQRFMNVDSLVVDENPTISVKAWRYSQNARGIVEVFNKLDGQHTAVVVVHPWGIDDGQGFVTPNPAGAAFFSSPEKNGIYLRHVKEVLVPFLESIRPHIALIGYSLYGKEDPIRANVYRSPRNQEVFDQINKVNGIKNLQKVLQSFNYEGQDIIESFPLIKGKELQMYFDAFKGSDASDRYNNAGFFELPIPLASSIKTAPNDIVFYDGNGYRELSKYLKKSGISNILLAGYATDYCLRDSVAGYKNLRKDFNVFIVGDATMASFSALQTPSMSTTVALSKASLDNLITEIDWIKIINEKRSL